MSNKPPVSAASDLARHKSELRRQLRQARQAISPKHRQDAAQRVAKLARPYLKSGRRLRFIKRMAVKSRYNRY